MKKHLRGEKKRPVLRMLLRLIRHCHSFEDFEELYNIQYRLLTVEESRTWYIWIFSEQRWRSPHDYKAYAKS